MRVEEKGTVLLLSLMIMSGIVISAVGVSALILSSLQQTRVIDASIVAYYAAESGIEDALYSARRLGEAPADVVVPETLSNDASWTRTVAENEPALYLGALRRDALTEIALYDPDEPTAATGIERVHIAWGDDCDDCSILQATLVGWQTGESIAWDPNAATRQYTRNAAGVDIPVVDGRLYLLRLSARNADLSDLVVTAWNGAGGKVNIPGRLKIDVTGAYVDTRQTLSAALPRRAPLSGAFDFVLFSECSLVKNAAGSCP